MERDNKIDESQPTPKVGSIPATTQWKRAALMARSVSAFKDTISVDSDEDVDTKQQIKYGTAYQAAWGIFSEYCNNSTIHGIKYLGEQKRPWRERLFWITVFVVSIYTCATLTKNIWDKWNNNPVIVSFAEKSTPVWQIPFPSVTVCQETKARQTVFNFTNTYWKISDRKTNDSIEPLTSEELYRLEAVSQVCEAHLMESEKIGKAIEKSSNLLDALSTVMPTFNQTYLQCKWRNLPEVCDKIFHRSITEEGICFTFNALNPYEVYRTDGLNADVTFDTAERRTMNWSPEDGYRDDAGADSYPNRVLAPGSKAGLYLILSGLEKDFDNMCRGPVQGFKILLNTPGEVPQVTKQYFRIPFDQEVLISVRPKIITTSQGLKHYDPHRRQCYFQTERFLRYFQIYTQSNCELECLSNFTYTQCGCVKFSMPRHSGVPVCGGLQIKCLNDAEDELLLREFNQGEQTSGESYRGKTDCNCLPSCTSIAYEAEISQADVDYKAVSKSLRRNGLVEDMQNEEAKSSKMSRLSIFFKESQFLTSRRSELYGITDFLANCGGLLGLFMGVSTLSIVELVYFCTVRLVTNLRMRHKNRKNQPNNSSKIA